MELRSALLLLLLVYTDISLSAAPTCKTGCTGQKGKVLNLQEGTTYVYNLDGSTETLIPKTSAPHGESSRLGIKAKVEVNIQAQCSAVIRLKNVQIIGPDDKKYGSQTKLEENPLRVSLNGGTLAPEICAVPDDDYTSLNIKRAVASLLQINSAESAVIPQEVDVFGSCPTVYSISKDGGLTLYNKRRNLNNCAYRENIRQEIFSIPNAGNSELQSTPLLETSYDAEIGVKDGVIERATITESYLFRPFSNNGNGAKTKVLTKLTLASKSAGSIPDTTKEPRSIIFENPHESASSSIQSVLAALRKVVESSDKTVDSSAAHNFAELVAIFRRASAEDLLSVYGQVKAGAGFKNKVLAKKLFTDALLRSGTGNSVAVAIELLKSRQIDDNADRHWFLSFAFARHASAAALEKAASLLDEPDIHRDAYLGVGALAGRYCREHLCEVVPQFNALLSKLAAPLAKTQPSSRADESKVVGALKGLRNVKKLNDDVAGKVAKIITDSAVSTRIRAAALDTAQSDACKNKLQKAASEVLNNREEDAELRIKAYLVLVECPNTKTANKLSEFIEAETVNQVGSYITSHLRNLRATANPDRQAARAVLQNVKPRKRFPIDIRRFSTNGEISYDIDALGSSASMDANVIYSQKSYVPRSANLNLTAEIFGHSFNLFEIVGRTENFERVIESYLGPKGYFRNNKPEDIVSDTKSRAESLRKLLEEKYRVLSRSKRSSPSKDQLNSFAEKVKLRNNELDNNVDLDLSLRILGNELLWTNLAENKKISVEEIINDVTKVLEKSFGKAKDFDLQKQNQNTFLDTELSYPTSTGLALKLTATGTSVVHLKLAGSLDLPAILRDAKNGQAKIDVRPSASIEVVGALTIDGYAVEAGLKLAASLHTATASEITVKLLDGQGIDINVGLPIKESDILSVRTEVLAAVRERGQPLTATPLDFKVPRKDYQGCFDQLLSLTGLTLCGKIGFPNDPKIDSGAALYPLNGGSELSLRLDKEDESLKTYHFRLQYNLRDPTNRRIEALIDTPGSTNPRELSLLAEAKTVPNKEINFRLNTPIYKLQAQAKVIDSDKEYSLSGLAEVEGIFKYSGRLGLLINGATYTPILEYTGPSGQPEKVASLEGTVTVDKSASRRTYTFNHVRITTEQAGVVSVDGTITRDTNLFQTDLKLGYDKETVGLKSKIQKQGDNNLKLVLEISPSQLPDFGFGLKYEYQRDKSHVENSLSFVHGKDLNSKQSRLHVFQQVTFNIESVQRFDISTKNTLTYPLFGVEGKLEGVATPKSVSYDLLLSYEKSKITSKLSAKTGISKPGDYEVDFNIGLLDRSIQIESKRDIVAPNKSTFKNTLILTPGGKYSLDSDVTYQLDKNNVDTRLVLTATLEGIADQYKLDVGGICNPSALEAHSKISIGATDYLDAELKQKKSEPRSGSFRFNLKRVILSGGEYKISDSKNNANIVIDILPLKRKLKGTADLTITGIKHTGSIEIQYDADKDPNQKLKIDTDTDLSAKSINSKNKVSVAGNELLVNFNGEKNGKPSNGGVSGGYDVTLPNGVHLVGRGKQSLVILPNNANAEFFIDLGYSTEKGSPLSKVTIDTYAKNVDFKRQSWDTKFELKSICPQGDVNALQTFSSIPQKDAGYVIELQNAIGGSRLGEYQYNGKLKIETSPAIKYHASASLGQKYSVDLQGSVEDNKNSGRCQETLTIKTPHSPVKEIKAVSNIVYSTTDDYTSVTVKATQDLSIEQKTYKLAVEGQASKKEGSGKVSVTIPDDAPYTAQLKYKHKHDSDIIKSEAEVEASHGDKNAKANLKADYTKDLSLLNTKLSGSSSLESAKQFDISAGYKRISSVSASADLKAQVNDNTVEANGKIDVTPNHPIIDINVVQNGKKRRVYLKMDRKSDRSGSGDMQIVWPEGQLDYSGSSDFENLENFLVILKLNSEALKLNKLKIEIGNRPTKSGAAKRVTVNAVNAEGKILSGSASYAIKEAGPNAWSIEGKGNVNYNNEEHPLTYKLSTDKGPKGIHGIVVFDYGVGSFNQEVRVEPNNFLLTQKNCFKKKCYSNDVVLSSVITDAKSQKLEATLKVSDKLFRDTEFELSSKTERNGLIVNSDSVATLGGNKYTVRAYVHEKDAGIVVNVPTRELALISNYQVPDFKKELVSAKADLSVYLDRKKSPNDKATLGLDATIKTADKSASGSATLKFTHPALPRELTVKGEASVTPNKAQATLEVDVFSKKGQKIILTSSAEQQNVDGGHTVLAKAAINSKGLSLDLGAASQATARPGLVGVGASAYYVDEKNLKKDVAVELELSLAKSRILLRVPTSDLINAEASIQSGTDQKSLDAQLTLAGGETAVLNVKTKGYHELSACLHPKSNPNRKLTALLGLSTEKLEARFERVEDSKTENLLSYSVLLDKDNFLKFNFDLQSENIRKSAQYFKKLGDELIERFRAIAAELGKELNLELTNLAETLKKAQPNLKPLLDAYQTAFKTLREEIENDKNIQAISKILHIKPALDAIEAQIKIIIKVYEKLSTEAADIQVKLIDAYKKISPEIVEFYTKLIKIYADFVKVVFDSAYSVLENVLKIVRRYEGDIKTVVQEFSNTFQDIAKLALKSISQFRNEIQDFSKLLLDQLKSSEVYGQIKEKIQELIKFELPPHFWEIYKELAVSAEELMPTPELKEITRRLFAYVEKRLRHEPVDDIAELSAIGKQGSAAIVNLVTDLLKSQGIDPNSWSALNFNYDLGVPRPVSGILRLPELGNIKFSPLNLLAAINELPSPLQLYAAYRPTYNPLDQIPPFKAYGVILNSHHFFTFDKKHFTFSGSCSYILAQDFQDGNFSVVANIEAGKIKSITVADKTDVVEILSDNTVAVNGQAGDFPVSVGEIAGWREYRSINLKLKAGVFIKRYIPQDIIVVGVSGFYFGRTRGLLGTINNEQYDELTLPNGHIAKDSSEFVSAYSVPNCPAAAPHPKAVAHVPECTALFTSDSSLRNYFIILSPEAYREACDEHASMNPQNAQKAACEVAAAYIVSLRKEGAFLQSIPSECAQCTVNGKKLELGQTEQINSPAGKADVILVLEQSSQNEGVLKELVNPLINTLTADLKGKGLGDVEYSLIGYGAPDNKWPQHYSVNGKISYDGKGDKLKFGDTERVKAPYDTFSKKIQYIQRYLKIELGLEQIVFAMNEANAYPFREGAARIIVLINTTPCSTSPTFPVSLQLPRTLSIYNFYKERGLKFFIVSPLADLSQENTADAKPKSIVGFDNDHIYSFSDAKKKPLEGSGVGRSGLDYKTDLCLQFSQFSGGAAFSSQNLLDAKPDQKKKFVQVVSQRIAQGATKYTNIEDATCTLKSGLFPNTVYSISSSELAKGR